ncbi:hypothetical protein MTO96_029780 [Rhipicephalus appendiculatus]
MKTSISDSDAVLGSKWTTAMCESHENERNFVIKYKINCSPCWNVDSGIPEERHFSSSPSGHITIIVLVTIVMYASLGGFEATQNVRSFKLSCRVVNRYGHIRQLGALSVNAKWNK